MKQRIALVVVLCVVSLLAYSLHSTASVEGYHQGTRVFSANSGSVSGTEIFQPGKFSCRVQILDLDIVGLAKAKTGCYRSIVQISREQAGGSTASTDIEKSKFDLDSLRHGRFDLRPFERPSERGVVRKLGRNEIFRRYLPMSMKMSDKAGERSHKIIPSVGYIAGYWVAE